MALAAYRHVLRSARIAFQGDHRLLAAAHHQARKEFNSKRNLSPDGEDARQGIAHAEEVAQVLRKNVVQGERLDGEEEKYRLKIHEETERGDNESIKKAGSRTGECCSA